MKPDVFELRGAVDGPRVLVTGGVHGDEYEGPAAIADFMAQAAKLGLAGTVTAIPVANPMAWRAATRLSPEDGLNLARTFPGNPGGSPTQQLAAGIWEIASRCDFAIDLHSGGVEYRFVPLAGFYGEPGPENPSYNAARHFGLPVLWQLPETDGVLSCELHRRGVPVVGCEYLGGGELSLRGAADYLRGIFSCLALWGLLDSSYLVDRPSSVYAGDWQLAEAEGVFRALVQLGQDVTPGRPLGEIRDHRGRVLQRFTATAAGRVLAIRNKAYIREGNWGVLVAQNV